MPWIRASIVASGILLWRWQTLPSVARSRSWSHHPLAGPFLAFEPEQFPPYLAIEIGLLVGILVPTLLWIRGGSWIALLATLAAIAASIAFSASSMAVTNC
jgi:hypothetical protein